MKKLLILALVCCLCFCSVAAAEEMPELEVAVSFDGVGVEVPNSAIGFLIPADFVKGEIAPEDAAQGMLLKASSADASYTLEVTLADCDYDTMLAALKTTEGVSEIQDYVINSINYLSYVVPESALQVGVVFLGENCDLALSFAFAVPTGVNAGQIPLEIMGSLYEL